MKYTSFCLVLVCFCVAFLQVGATNTSSDKPVERALYNIANMVNNRNQLDEWLNYGANAIESDVSFAKYGSPLYFYHGVPCDAFRLCSKWDYILPYIEAVRARTEPDSPKYNPNFTLLMFNVKVEKLEKQILKTAGRKFADFVLIPLLNNTAGRLKSILTHRIPDDVEDFINGVLDRLNETNPQIILKIGFEIKRLAAVSQESLQRIPVGHIWLGEGASNWFVPVLKWALNETLAKLVEQKIRAADLTKVSKVYTWTVDPKWLIRYYLQTGIDAIITNYPQNVNQAIDEFNKKSRGIKFRLATLDDNPFATL